MEREVTGRGRAAALILPCLVIIGAALPWGCREIIAYDDTGPPGTVSPIVWERTGPDGEAILALRVDQANILYAGTGSGALYWSVTDGDSWSIFALPYADGAITGIVVDPARGLFVSNDVHGIFFSPDGGETWAQANTGLTDTAIFALSYVAGGTLVAGSARGLVSALPPGGSAWSERFSVARPVTSLQPVSTRTVYLSAWGAGVYEFSPTDSSALSANPGLQDLYVNVVHAGAGGYLYAGTRSNGIFRSDAAPIFWQSTGGGTINREVIVLRTSSYGELFAGTLAGVYLSTDQGMHWTHLIEGIGTQEVRALAVDGSARVFAGTVDGVYRSVRVGRNAAAAR